MINLTKNASQRNIKYLALVCIASFFMQACSSGDGSPRFKDVEEIDVKTSTQGVITEVEEIEPGNEYKVLDETVIDDKSASMAIVHHLDGTTDSVSFAKLENDDGSYHKSSSLRPFLMGTLAATFFRRNMGRATLDPKAYKNPAGYTKSQGLKGNLASTASTRRVKVPGKGSKGYGGKRSFRSFGG
jgi:hypothetical protein